MDQNNDATMLKLTTDIVAAYVSNNAVPAAQLPDAIRAVHASLRALAGETPGEAAGAPKPAINPKRSITPDYLVCLEDGKRLKMLKRHLRTAYNMTPAEYRAKWGLPPDYPMVAPNYAAQRSQFAKDIGLGRKGTRARRRVRKA